MIFHVHSHHSDGLLSVEELLERGDAVVVVDHLSPIGSTRAHLMDHRRAPLVGVELYVSSGERNEHLTAIAFSESGYRRLCELISQCPLPPGWGWAERLEGLVITTSCMSSVLYRSARELREDLLREASSRIRDAGGVFAVEAFPHDLDGRLRPSGLLLEVAARFADGRILISSDFHLPSSREDWIAYRLGMSARPGGRYGIHPIKGGEEFYKKMLGAKDYITQIVDAPLPRWLEALLPSGPIAHFGVPPAPEEDIASFREWVRSKAGCLDQAHRDAVMRELHIVSSSREVLSYITLVWRVLLALEESGIPAFLRGSAAGSALCWLMAGCRTPSPVLNSCMFERFYNPRRSDLPDIDLDVPNQQEAVRALRERGFVVERLCAIRTAPDPEEAIRSAASAIGRAPGRKAESVKNAEAIASLFSCTPDEVFAAAQRLSRSGFPLDLLPHPSGFVIVPPGWPSPPLPKAPQETGLMAALLTAEIVSWKVDILQSDALKPHLGLPYLKASAAAQPGYRVANAFRLGAAGLFQIGPRAMAQAISLRERHELLFEDICRLVAQIRPGASGFLYQEDAMRAVMERAKRMGLDPLGLADAARRYVAKADEGAWRELESALREDRALLERLRKSGGYAFCLAHAVAYGARLLADMLAVLDGERGLELLLKAASRERDRAMRASILLHLLIRAFQGGAHTVRLSTGESRISNRCLIIGKDVMPEVSSLIGLARRMPFTKESVAEGLLSQLTAQQVGFSIETLIAAAAVIANPKSPDRDALAGAYVFVSSSRSLEPMLITAYGPIAVDRPFPGPGLAVWDGERWAAYSLKRLAKDPRVPDRLLEPEA